MLLTAILNGDPKGYEALFADREDITLGNPVWAFCKWTGCSGEDAGMSGCEVVKVQRTWTL